MDHLHGWQETFKSQFDTLGSPSRKGCGQLTSVLLQPAQVMQSYLPSPTTYLLSSGTGIRCRAAKERGHDIISLEVSSCFCLRVLEDRLTC